MTRKQFAFLAILLMVGLLARVLATAVSPTLAQSDPQAAALDWLVNTHQNDDGGYSSFSAGANQAPSDFAGTFDALLAIAAAGGDASKPLAYLEEQAADVAAYAASEGGSAGKALLALSMAGADPHDFTGQDLSLALTEHISPTGQYNTYTAYTQALAILGLIRVGDGVDGTAVTWLQSLQAEDGSWDDGYGTNGNIDATAMSVMALVANGISVSDDSLIRAGDFLRQAQIEGGGWEYSAGFGENANSTALAIQALSALGDDVTPYMDALLTWQGESGAFQADFGDGRFDDFFTTVQAIPALTGRPYPFRVLTDMAIAAEPAQLSEEPALTKEPVSTEVAPSEEPTPTEEAAPVTQTETQPAETTPAEESGAPSFIFIVIAAVIVLAGAYWAIKRG
ncbi:MAG: hypothetical protein H6664_06340 [Ardenticatenaceae bacterium]|nr:hypothetical protein [Ardenticatenaceae bacterium]MCB9003977.1 hypothetical protein [Ardenticatenaceae bacterium]